MREPFLVTIPGYRSVIFNYKFTAIYFQNDNEDAPGAVRRGAIGDLYDKIAQTLLSVTITGGVQQIKRTKRFLPNVIKLMTDSYCGLTLSVKGSQRLSYWTPKTLCRNIVLIQSR